MRSLASNTGDSARVAAQIVCGSGFLSAGMLLRGRDRGQEMSTAFTIWLSAAVGMTSALVMPGQHRA
jgi:putative Mg2+ transporter-C (MgtC) family protein